jgi:hypothetical protein
MKRILLVMGMICFAALGACVFHLKYHVSQLADTLKALDIKKRAIQENIQLLRAEWAHLNEPSRLEALTQKYLPLTPMKAPQMMSLKDLAHNTPTPTSQDYPGSCGS